MSGWVDWGASSLYTRCMITGHFFKMLILLVVMAALGVAGLVYINHRTAAQSATVQYRALS